MYDFSTRIAVVTGAAQGIGRAIAEGFIKNNVKTVVLLDYNGDGVKATAAELDPEGAKTLAFKCDVSDKESVHAVFTEIYEKLGRVDILVNNAGINRDAMFHKMTADQFRSVIEVNFFGAVNCAGEVILKMREQEFGRIINISSVSAHGSVGQTNYSASKAAVNGFTRSLALESARKNITVNAIEPGFIETDMLRSMPEEIYNAKLKAHPAQKFGSPDQLANAVLFLASDEGAWVNGNIMIVSGAGRVV